MVVCEKMRKTNNLKGVGLQRSMTNLSLQMSHAACLTVLKAAIREKEAARHQVMIMVSMLGKKMNSILLCLFTMLIVILALSVKQELSLKFDCQ